jgi:hypothetical protein
MMNARNGKAVPVFRAIEEHDLPPTDPDKVLEVKYLALGGIGT